MNLRDYLKPRFLRSVPLKLYDLHVPRETAFQIISHLGELSLLHFLDSSPAVPLYSRRHANSVKRCESALLKLDELNEIMNKFNKQSQKHQNITIFLNELYFFLKKKNSSEREYLDEIEGEIEEKYSQLQNQLLSFTNISKQRGLLQEHRISLLKAKNLIKKNPVLQEQSVNLSAINDEFDQEEAPFDIKLHYFIGLILQEDMIRFKRILFRASKGNAIIFSEDLKAGENPLDLDTVSLFLLAFFLENTIFLAKYKNYELFLAYVQRRHLRNIKRKSLENCGVLWSELF